MKKKLFLLSLISLACFSLFSGVLKSKVGTEEQTKEVGLIKNNGDENKILELINLKRKENNLSEFEINPKLNEAARNKALDMFKNQYWAHNSPSGKTPWFFIKESKYEYQYAGENLAKGFNDDYKLVEGWMNSTEHRENILNQKYKDVGIATVKGKMNGKEINLTVMMMGSQNTSITYLLN